MSHALLEKLWSLADAEAARTGGEPSLMFEPIGLWFDHSLRNAGYLTTPLNSSTFANTGGDGVHYGLLHVEGEVKDNCPVVMTVPMAGEDVIVGADLHEFLCLGCELGYFPLEQLVYDRDGMIRTLAHPDEVWEHRYRDDEVFFRSNPDRRDEMGRSLRREQDLLKLLCTEFQLKPWDCLEERLSELQEKYLSLLELPPQPEVVPQPRPSTTARISAWVRSFLSDLRRRK